MSEQTFVPFWIKTEDQEKALETFLIFLETFFGEEKVLIYIYHVKAHLNVQNL